EYRQRPVESRLGRLGYQRHVSCLTCFRTGSTAPSSSETAKRAVLSLATFSPAVCRRTVERSSCGAGRQACPGGAQGARCRQRDRVGSRHGATTPDAPRSADARVTGRRADSWWVRQRVSRVEGDGREWTCASRVFRG